MPISSRRRRAATAKGVLVHTEATAALLALISYPEKGASKRRIELDDAGWDAFVREATRHGVAPLAFAGLDAQQRDGTPDAVLRKLKGSYVRTGMQNLRLYARLAELLRDLAGEGIAAIVLKGAFLAQTVYRNAALRSMGDADVLVWRADLERVASVMQARGWRQPHPLASTAAGHQLPTFVRDAVQVEIHWGIEDDASPFTIDVEGLWQRACRMRIAGVPTLALSPEDLMLHLCLHTSYGHSWLQFDGGLRAFCDIAASLEHYASRFDWDAFVQRAHAWRVANCAWLTLVLARDLVGAVVPQQPLGALAAGHMDPNLVHVARGLALNDHYVRLASALPALGPAWLTKRWRHLSRAARWRKHLLPERSSLAKAYPSIGVGPAYLAHWIELVSDGMRIGFAREGRMLWSHERSRLALIGWLELPAKRDLAPPAA
jgi:hypothetical protein